MEQAKLDRIGMRGEHFVAYLRPKFQHNKDWTAKRVYDEMLKIEPLARKSMAPWVLRTLRGVTELPQEQELLLLQGLVSFLRRQGFGVVIFVCDAASVRAQIYANAKNSYHMLERAAIKAGKLQRKQPFKPTDLTDLVDRYKDPESGESVNKFVVGAPTL